MTPEALVQVYAGRAFRWRGIFGVHSWIATKERDAPYRGPRCDRVARILRRVDRRLVRLRTGSVLVTPPERPSYAERRQTSDKAYLAAVDSYPHSNEYLVWPGPNSNTFVAHIARQVPELKLDLPPTAIGKDYLPHAALVGETPSNTGIQVSLVGALGVLVGLEEGVELNLLGLTLGFDPLGPALKLPGIGRVGPK